MHRTASLMAALLLAFGVAHAEPARYNLDPDHTQVEFSWNHFGFSNLTGRFDKVEGNFQFDPVDPTRSSIDVSIPMASIDTGVGALDEGNYKKTMAAPVVVIVAYDLAFYEKSPVLFPHTDAKSWFDGKTEAELTTIALRNGSLQGAYLLLSARALGLDCGPMSGFDNAKVDAAFFAGTRIRSNFLINLGVGDRASIFARSPRLGFDEACRIE